MPDPTPDPSAVLGGGDSGSAPAPVLGGQGSVPPPPTLNNGPVASQRPGQTPAAPPPQAPPADPHSTLVGRVFKHVTNALEGKQTQYVPDTTPDGTPTGQVKAVEVPRKAGGLFRDILGGMLTGMAAGAAHPRAGLGGLGLGYAAARDQQQSQDNQARTRAMQQAQAQKTTAAQDQTDKSQNQVAQAAVAQQTMNVLHLGHNIGLHDDSEVSAHNNAMDVVKTEAMKAGGQLAQVDENGKPGNGPALMAQFNKDPKMMQGPDGYHRIPFVSYDTSGLEHKDGKWMEKDGTEPDWNQRAAVSLVDLPNGAWNKQVVLPRKAANDVAGRQISDGKPTDSVSSTFGGLFSLGLKNVSQMNADREEKNRGPQDEKEAESWVSAAQGVGKGDPDYDKITKRADKAQAFLDAKSGTSLAGKAPTKTGIALQTEQLGKNLANYAAGKGPNLTPDERATLVQRQKEEAIKGVPGDIIAAIGSKPVPAQFERGEEDPAYKAASRLWGQASLDKKTALQAASGMSRYQMMGDIRDYNVTNATDKPVDLDPQHPGTNVLQPNESGRVTANQLKTAPSGVVLNTQDGLKVMSKGAIIRDVQTNVDNLREKISSLDNLDVGTRTKLIAALRDPNPDSAMHNFMVSEAKSLTDPKLQDALIAMQYMAENVMALRSIQGVGSSGSDLARRALMALVPDATTPSKEFAGKQLDAFQRTLNQLKTGVPTVGGRSLEPVSGARNPAKPGAPAPPAGASAEVHDKAGKLIGHVVNNKFVALGQ